MTVVYAGELHAEASHGPSGALVATDAPLDNHGKGESFSPTDLVGAALGSCMLTVMGIHAQREGWAIEGARAAVVKIMSAAPARRISELRVRITMPADIPADARGPLENTARSCPVAQSLHPDSKIDLEFSWV